MSLSFFCNSRALALINQPLADLLLNVASLASVPTLLFSLCSFFKNILFDGSHSSARSWKHFTPFHLPKTGWCCSRASRKKYTSCLFVFFIDHLTHRERSCLSGLKEQQGNVWTAHRSMITLDPRQSGQ